MSRERTARIVLVALVAAVAGGLPVGAQYATEVVDYSRGGAPENVLGEPDCSNAVDFGSVGATAGFVTVGFGGVIPDRSGDDVSLVITGFQPGQQFVEDFELLASADGTTFVSLGYRNPNDFAFGPQDEVTFGFDLEDAGLASAVAVKVLNRQIVTGTNSEGPDICGFEASGVTQALYACDGFDSPMASGPVKVRRSRALPLKAAVLDAGFALTDLDLAAPPVLQVVFSDPDTSEAIDVSDDAVPAGQGTEGNQFVYEDGLWRFNLRTDNYTSPGTYTVTLVSGDPAAYHVDGCEAVFVVLP